MQWTNLNSIMKTTSTFAMSLLSSLLLVTGCKTNSKEEKETALVSGITKANMDTLVKPGDNFMKYVNGSWIKKATIPGDKGRYGTFTQLRDASDENVKAIIDEVSKGTFEAGSDEQKMGDLYTSFMDMEKRDQIGVAPLEEEFSKIDAITSVDDLAAFFAYARKYRYSVPLSLYVSQDYKDPETYVVYLSQSGLGMPDREYYLKEDDRSKEIQKQYVAHVAKMFELVGDKNAAQAADQVMALETKIATQHLEKEKTRDRVALYNMLSTDTLPKLTPSFNWSLYLKEIGLTDLDKIVVLMKDYTAALDTILTSTDIATWKTYLKWGVINSNASNLTSALDTQNWNFYSKELRGTSEQEPLWKRGVSRVNGTFGELVGKVYVKEHFPPEAKTRMQTLVDNLLKAYEVSIKELDWMSEDTKKEALDKLHKFNPKIGYPDKWKTYDVTIAPDDLYGNVKRARLMEFNRNMEKLGQPVDKEEWGMTPQTVNAYYSSTKNEIVFPAAILQPPFFNLEAEDAVNYGAIGAVIGHEIGHGFDDSGSSFDGDGAMRNWWTDQDKEEFKKRTSALVAQYDAFEVLPGVHVNGTFTLGENIGDLGGLSIGLKAYNMSLNGEEAPVMDGLTGEQRVFIGYAQVWCGKARAESLRNQVSTDPHSPLDFRVNGVVRNVPAFYEAFDIAPSDSLYLKPEERVKIW